MNNYPDNYDSNLPDEGYPSVPVVIERGFAMSEKIGDLTAALAKAQSKITGAIKSVTGQIHNRKYSYADLANVYEACRDQLSENGIAVIQFVHGGHDNASVTITTMLTLGEQWFRASLTLQPEMATAQGIGSAITYGRRYQLMGMVGIAPEDDDGRAASAPATRTQNTRPVAEETDHELQELTHELQSVMSETAEDDKQRDAIAAMSAEAFARGIMTKKNHGNPLTKLVLDDLLKDERSKAAKIRQIAHTKKKAEPTMRTDRYLSLVNYVAGQANMTVADVEPHVLAWLERTEWTKLSLKKKAVADEIHEAAKQIDWTTIRAEQIPA